MNLWLIFLTGLTTGGLSCAAMQGGLLAGVLANSKNSDSSTSTGEQNKKLNRKEKKRQAYLNKIQNKDKSFSLSKDDVLPVGMFLISKFGVHVVLGFLLGMLGSVITLNLTTRMIFQVAAALFMVGTAANLLNIHPIFRYLAFQPPKFMQKWVRNTSKSETLFAPGILGLMTVLIPCGITQAMEVLAINSGSPVQGALIMGAFVLGTSPLFTIIGLAVSKMSEAWSGMFNKVAAYSLVAMALYSLNGVMVVMDAPFSVQKVMAMYQKIQDYEKKGVVAGINTVPTKNGIQAVDILVQSHGYSPSYVQVQKGVPVEMTLTSKDTYSCALAFVFREFGINANLRSTDSKTFTFTPTRAGRFTYTCSMGMYSGVMEVI